MKFGIAKKIGCGYALAIGVASLGVSCGLIVGDRYQEQAEEQLRLANAKRYLLNDLEASALTVQSHPQNLLKAVESAIRFDYETNLFKDNLNSAKALLDKLRKLTHVNADSDTSDVDDRQIQQLTQDYINTLSDYEEFVTSLWSKIAPQNLKPTQAPQAIQQIAIELSGKRGVQMQLKFQRLSEELIRLKQTIDIQYTQAEKRFKQAKELRLYIITTSIVLSLVVATLLAIITSRAIAYPLETVTAIAQQVTKEANFKLKAPEHNNDEVGLLATALNQLIQWTGEYTDELQSSRQNLELRVQERTQELQEALQELQLTQLQLIQNEKMSSLGQMVAGVAHEINNPVGFIHGNLSHAEIYMQDMMDLLRLYQTHYPNPDSEIQTKIEALDLEFLIEDFHKLLQSMRAGTERIREIVKSLRVFSRLDEEGVKKVNLHEGIDSTLVILENRLKQKPGYPKIQVIKEYGQLPLVECHAGQMNQVFMNILSNAIDAVENVEADSEKWKVSESSGATSPTIRICTQVMQQNSVRIQIADNGAGIPEEIQRRLFDPFFTTKPVGKGTGLGLSISHQIVTETHGGSLFCHSTLGQGTEFFVEIPIKFSYS